MYIPLPQSLWGFCLGPFGALHMCYAHTGVAGLQGEQPLKGVARGVSRLPGTPSPRSKRYIRNFTPLSNPPPRGILSCLKAPPPNNSALPTPLASEQCRFHVFS